jgi:hypothetical protein
MLILSRSRWVLIGVLAAASLMTSTRLRAYANACRGVSQPPPAAMAQHRQKPRRESRLVGGKDMRSSNMRHLD